MSTKSILRTALAINPQSDPRFVSIIGSFSDTTVPKYEEGGHIVYNLHGAKARVVVKKVFAGNFGQGFTNSCALVTEPPLAITTLRPHLQQQNEVVTKIFDSTQASGLRNGFDCPPYDIERAQVVLTAIEDGTHQDMLAKMDSKVDPITRGSQLLFLLAQCLRLDGPIRIGDLFGFCLQYWSIGQRLLYEGIIPDKTILTEEVFLRWKMKQLFLHELSIFCQISGSPVEAIFPTFIASVLVEPPNSVWMPDKLRLHLAHPAILIELIEGFSMQELIRTASIYGIHSENFLHLSSRLKDPMTSLTGVADALIASVQASLQLGLAYTDIRPDNIIFVRADKQKNHIVRLVDVGALQPLNNDYHLNLQTHPNHRAIRHKDSYTNFKDPWTNSLKYSSPYLHTPTDIHRETEDRLFDYLRPLSTDKVSHSNIRTALATNRFQPLHTRDDTLKWQIIIEAAYDYYLSSDLPSCICMGPEVLRCIRMLLEYTISDEMSPDWWEHAIYLVYRYIDYENTWTIESRDLLAEPFKKAFRTLSADRSPDTIFNIAADTDPTLPQPQPHSKCPNSEVQTTAANPHSTDATRLCLQCSSAHICANQGDTGLDQDLVTTLLQMKEYESLEDSEFVSTAAVIGYIQSHPSLFQLPKPQLKSILSSVVTLRERVAKTICEYASSKCGSPCSEPVANSAHLSSNLEIS